MGISSEKVEPRDAPLTRSFQVLRTDAKFPRSKKGSENVQSLVFPKTEFQQHNAPILKFNYQQ